MSVAIIGAGASGLAAARHVLNCGSKMDVFEMRSELGGTWVYTDDVGKDQYGYPVHSAMYRGLRTNLPKDVMGYLDFPIPEEGKSYMTQEEVLDYLNTYAEHFGLNKHIRLNTMVTDVRPVGDQWKVTSVHKPTGKYTENIYDYVMICVGHYNDPIIPQIQGQELFEGLVDHSRNFRGPAKFEGRKVLVIGAGPSGLELTLLISSVAEYVVLSHHMTDPIKTKYPANVQMKSDVKRILDSNNVEFVDGSCCYFNAILFCTGYRYSFPFLHESCGVTIEENHIQPLYKHIIVIGRPSMCFIGVPFQVCTMPLFDLQARYYCKYLSGSMSLPSTGEMQQHTLQDIENRKTKGYPKCQMHLIGPDQQTYYDDLAQEAKVPSIAPVIVKLRNLSVERLYADLLNFREDQYKIVDDNNFVKISNDTMQASRTVNGIPFDDTKPTQ